MRIAIITGASSGMGREFVRQLSAWERFDELWVIARREERLKSLAGETELPIRPLELDLAKPERVQELEALLAREQPEVGLLINCAGYGKFGRADELSPEEQLVLDRMLVHPYKKCTLDLMEELHCEMSSVYRLRAAAIEKLLHLRYGAGASANAIQASNRTE